MARPKKKQPNRKRAAPRKKPARRRRARLSWPTISLPKVGAWLNRAVLAVIALGTFGAIAFGYGPLRDRVGGLRADPLVVVFEWPAMARDASRTWLNIEEQDRLRDIALAHLSPDPFDAQSLAQTRAALDRTGWFRVAPTVRRRAGGVVEISGAWRAPAAVVRVGPSDYLVSEDGALLPVRYPAGGAGAFPVIINTYTGPPRLADGSTGFGVVWPGGDVRAAIGLWAYLRGSPRAGEIAALDASRYVSKGLLTIRTRSGGRIVWGGAPGAGVPGEAADAIKRERFERLFDDPALLASGRPPVEIYTRLVLIDETARP